MIELIDNVKFMLIKPFIQYRYGVFNGKLTCDDHRALMLTTMLGLIVRYD